MPAIGSPKSLLFSPLGEIQENTLTNVPKEPFSCQGRKSHKSRVENLLFLGNQWFLCLKQLYLSAASPGKCQWSHRHHTKHHYWCIFQSLLSIGQISAIFFFEYGTKKVTSSSCSSRIKMTWIMVGDRMENSVCSGTRLESAWALRGICGYFQRLSPGAPPFSFPPSLPCR